MEVDKHKNISLIPGTVQLYPGSHELRIHLLLYHQGQTLVLGRLVGSGKERRQVSGDEDCRIGLFGLAKSIFFLGLHTIRGQATVYYRTLWRRAREYCFPKQQ